MQCEGRDSDLSTDIWLDGSIANAKGTWVVETSRFLACFSSESPICYEGMRLKSDFNKEGDYFIVVYWYF